jgi:hypothetical protein
MPVRLDDFAQAQARQQRKKQSFENIYVRPCRNCSACIPNARVAMRSPDGAGVSMMSEDQFVVISSSRRAFHAATLQIRNELAIGRTPSRFVIQIPSFL